MKTSRFWSYLLLITFLSSVGIHFIHTNELLAQHESLSWVFLLFMCLATIVLFILGKRTIGSSNKFSFVRMVISSIMIKIVLVLVILVLYVKLYEPDNRYFVFPVLLIYLIFSVFETYMLYRQALIKPPLGNE